MSVSKYNFYKKNGYCVLNLFKKKDISIIKETNEHSITALLEESLEHERKAVSLYKELLFEVVDKSIYLEEYAKEMIKNEEIHSLTVEKMLKDYE